MQLRTFIEGLVFGALSQSNMAKVILKDLTTLNPELPTEEAPSQFPAMLGKLVNAINLGLTQIYTDLPLAQEELFLQTNSAMDRYLLDVKHAEYAGRNTQDQKWIIDSALSPFRGNVIECLHVSDEYGARWYTNDSVATWNVNFPAPNVIQVPFAEEDVSLSIVFKANHPKIEFSFNRTVIQTDGSFGYIKPDMDLELPEYLYDALTCFVASKYYASLGSVEAIAQSHGLHAEYVSAIDNIKRGQVIHGDFTELDNLANEGWV